MMIDSKTRLAWPRWVGLLAGLFFAGGQMLAVAADKDEESEDKPGGEVRSPRAGEEVQRHFRAKGKTRNVPKGYLVIVFRTITGEDGFLFPCTEPFRGNRSFSEMIYHEERDQGTHAIQVRMMPEKVAKELDEWRKKIIKWHEGGRQGKEPPFSPEWMDKTTQLARVEYELEEQK